MRQKSLCLRKCVSENEFRQDCYLSRHSELRWTQIVRCVAFSKWDWCTSSNAALPQLYFDLEIAHDPGNTQDRLLDTTQEEKRKGERKRKRRVSRCFRSPHPRSWLYWSFMANTWRWKGSPPSSRIYRPEWDWTLLRKFMLLRTSRSTKHTNKVAQNGFVLCLLLFLIFSKRALW